MEPELLEGFRLSVSKFLKSVLEGSLHREVKDLISDTLRRVSRCGCSGDVMTSPQLHQLSSQIIMLQCLMRRQAAAEFLQTEPELAAELAAEAASHGPLVLLHLPLLDYRPVNEDATPRKRKWRHRQAANDEGEIWSSSNSDKKPVAIEVVPENRDAPPEGFMPMIPIKSLLLKRQRRRQRRAARSASQQGLDVVPANEIATGRPAKCQKSKDAPHRTASGECGEPVSTPPRRKPGRPRKGTEPLIPKQLRKLDFKLPLKQPPKKHLEPSSAGTEDQRYLVQERPASTRAFHLRPQALTKSSGKLGRSQAFQRDVEERATRKTSVSGCDRDQGQEAGEPGAAGQILGGELHQGAQQRQSTSLRPNANKLRKSRLEGDDDDRLGGVPTLQSAQQVPAAPDASGGCPQDIVAELSESNKDIESSDADQANEKDAPKPKPQMARRAEDWRPLPLRFTEPTKLAALRPVRVPPVAEEENFCSVCGDEDGDDSENEVLLCDGEGCQVAVHQQCYGISKLPDSFWLCEGCAAGVSPASSACLLCPCSGGALRRVRSLKAVQAPAAARGVGGRLQEGFRLQDGEGASSNGTPLRARRRNRSGAEAPTEGKVGAPLWVHSACALWTADVKFAEPEKLDGVRLDDLTQGCIDTLCVFCRQGGGAAVGCSFARCDTAFHPLCGRSNGCILPLANSGRTLAFCGLHSHDQYATARERMTADE